MDSNEEPPLSGVGTHETGDLPSRVNEDDPLIPLPPEAPPHMRIFLKEGAIRPVRATPNSAGLDLHACEDVSIGARSRAIVRTGVHLEIPHNCYGRIAPKSSLSLPGRCIDVAAGVVDQEYRGELKVILVNDSDDELLVAMGDSIAQILIQPVVYPTVELVHSVGDLESTILQENEFGAPGTCHFRRHTVQGEESLASPNGSEMSASDRDPHAPESVRRFPSVRSLRTTFVEPHSEDKHSTNRLTHVTHLTHSSPP